MKKTSFERIGTFTALVFLATLVSTAANAKSRFGAGIMIGDPTGLSFKYGMKSKNAIDVGFAWSGKVDLHIHADYLWHRNNFFNVEGVPFDAYYGIGARLRQLDSDKFRDPDDDDTRLGARGPVGIRWIAKGAPIEVFLELALIFDVVPETDAGIDGGIGVRYFF